MYNRSVAKGLPATLGRWAPNASGRPGHPRAPNGPPPAPVYLPRPVLQLNQFSEVYYDGAVARDEDFLVFGSDTAPPHPRPPLLKAIPLRPDNNYVQQPVGPFPRQHFTASPTPHPHQQFVRGHPRAQVRSTHFVQQSGTAGPSHASAILLESVQVGSLVEFDCGDSTVDRRLGIVHKLVSDGQVNQNGQATSNTWLVEVTASSTTAPGTNAPNLNNANAQPADRYMKVGQGAITFVWPRQHMGVVYEYTTATLDPLEKHAKDLLTKNRNQLPIVWGACVDRNITSVHTHYVAEQIFGPDPKPHELYITHCLLTDHVGKLHFKQSGMYTFSPKTLRQVEFEKKQVQAKQREGGDTLLFLHRLQRQLRALVADKDGRDAFLLQAIQAQLPGLSESESASALSSSPSPVGSKATNAPVTATNKVLDPAFLEQLKTYALATPHHPPSERVYARLLEPLRIGKHPEEVFRMLVRLGIMDTYANPHLGRYTHKVEFESRELQAFLSAAARWYECLAPLLKALDNSTANDNLEAVLRELPPFVDRDCNIRKDLRRQGPIFTIDGSMTSDEIDDGICVVTREDGSTWVYIHIADPSRVVLPNDGLDLSVRQRAMSLFIPERVFTMFPTLLARDHFSLLPDKSNFALSFGVCIRPETGEVLDFEITPSLIGPVHALTYEHADALLQSTSTEIADGTRPDSIQAALKTLSQLANVRREYRRSNGAVFLDMPRPDITVSDHGEQVQLNVVRDTESPSRLLVTEMMILVGEVTAQFGKKNGIALPYRSQALRGGSSSAVNIRSTPSAPTMRAALDSPQHWKTVVQQLDIMSSLSAAQTEVEPRPHRGLGVEAYCQATSPIRRYTDLLVHYQIKSVLRGEAPPFDTRKLRSLLGQVEQRAGELNSLSVASQRYWIFRYLERQDSARQYTAAVLGSDVSSMEPATSLLFVDLGWRTSVPTSDLLLSPPHLAAPSRGELLQLLVKQVDAFNDRVQFSRPETTSSLNVSQASSSTTTTTSPSVNQSRRMRSVSPTSPRTPLSEASM